LGLINDKGFRLKTVKIGICGLGTVGSGTFNVIRRNWQEINARAGCEIQIVQVGCRRDNAACDMQGVAVTRDIFEVANNPDVDILVELIGGVTTAKTLIETAIARGKHVVTANKALIAQHGNELFAAARAKGVSIAFEAAVAGGIPIIRILKEGLSANRIEWLAGIINGTGNFILTEMRDKGRAFADVLAEAQRLGYAEADPTYDVEGIDAAHKLAILGSLAFGMPLQYSSVYTEGISKIAPMDVFYAGELGYRIKHLGIARKHADNRVELRVHPTFIPERRLIASVDGVSNAVAVKGDAVGPTLYYGPGAGAEPTGSAVISDIIELSRTLLAPPEYRAPYLGFQDDQLTNYAILPIEEIETSYYLRMSAADQPGVLSRITQILSDAGISIEALIQKQPQDDDALVPVILLTNRVQEKKLNRAISLIEALDTVVGSVVRIRVESL
jgi:homoserine dehydrogenase